MKTAVFSKDKINEKSFNCLGWLKHDDSFANYLDFAIPCTSKAESWGVDHVHFDRVHFSWAVLGASREASIWYCRVLRTDASSEMLNRCRDFKWFAEEYGEKVPALSLVPIPHA